MQSLSLAALLLKPVPGNQPGQTGCTRVHCFCVECASRTVEGEAFPAEGGPGCGEGKSWNHGCFPTYLQG